MTAHGPSSLLVKDIWIAYLCLSERMRKERIIIMIDCGTQGHKEGRTAMG